MVLNAAMAVAVAAIQNDSVDPDIFRPAIEELLMSLAKANDIELAHGPLLSATSALRSIGLDQENLDMVATVFSSAVNTNDRPLVLSTFMLLCTVDPAILLGKDLSPVRDIRDYLTSSEPNDQALFLSCLDAVDPVLWAGTKPETMPLVLEEWEIERVMGFLDSFDPLVRKKTLAILNKIDGNIVSTYYVQSVETMPPDLPLPAREAYVSRLLEVIEMRCDHEGEAYAHAVLDLLRKLSMFSAGVSASTSGPSASNKASVLESVVAAVLEHVRFGDATFRVSCATTFVASIVGYEGESSLMTESKASDGSAGGNTAEPTGMVIAAALGTEFCGQLAMSPASLLRGFSSRLSRCPAGVQDACLLAMLRISAECERVPPDIMQTVQEIAKRAGRHIRRRCTQFVALSDQPAALRDVLQRAKSQSLPDFLEALQSTPIRESSPITSKGTSGDDRSPALTEQPLSESKLRYDAYEAPRPTARIRTRRLSSTSSIHSGVSADRQMSRTISPGQLAVVGQMNEYGGASKMNTHVGQPKIQTAVDDVASRVDLIAFDSPFMSDPPTIASPGADAAHEVDFERIWNTLENASSARGWCEAGLEDIVNRLRGLELPVQTVAEGSPPFLGELKIIVQGAGGEPGNSAILRVRANDSDGCLWRMRCGDASLQIQIKRLLTDA